MSPFFSLLIMVMAFWMASGKEILTFRYDMSQWKLINELESEEVDIRIKAMQKLKDLLTSPAVDEDILTVSAVHSDAGVSPVESSSPQVQTAGTLGGSNAPTAPYVAVREPTRGNQCSSIPALLYQSFSLYFLISSLTPPISIKSYSSLNTLPCGSFSRLSAIFASSC